MAHRRSWLHRKWSNPGIGCPAIGPVKKSWMTINQGGLKPMFTTVFAAMAMTLGQTGPASRPAAAIAMPKTEAVYAAQLGQPVEIPEGPPVQQPVPQAQQPVPAA